MRILAALLLTVTLLTLSGLTATASTLVSAATVHSCCDADSGGHAAPEPCSSPDCPCFSCMTMIVHPPVVSRRSGELQILPPLPFKRHPVSAFVSSIDYPPEQP